jgi:signal transduction histidine kinase
MPLNERARLYSTLMDAPVVMSIYRGPDLVIEFANRLFRKLTGPSRAIDGKTFEEAFPEIAPEVVALHKKVFHTGRPFVSPEFSTTIDYEMNGKPYERIWNLTYQPTRDADGEIDGVLTCASEVTEHVRSRRKLQETLRGLLMERHKLEALFRDSPAAIALWKGPKLIFEMVNPGYQSLFPGRKLLGLPLDEAIPELSDQPFSDLLRGVLETGQSYVGHEALARHRARADGPIEDRYYDFVYVRINDGNGEPFGVYDHAVEVTDRVLSRRALEQYARKQKEAIEELRQERELREHFVATLTHDLRTPLTAAKLATGLVLRKAADNPELMMLASRLEMNLDRADRMIRDLLDANRIKAGERLPLEMTNCDLKSVVIDAITDLGAIHGDRFILNAIGDFVGHWSCDGLRRVLENLCVNAIKYGANDRPVAVNLARLDHRVLLGVHNEGAPIPPEDQANLFVPFRRTTAAAKGVQKGWGLGLGLVKGIVEAHGGTVRLESGEGKGTTFWVELPRLATIRHQTP